MYKFLSFLRERMTFKRLVILIILSLFALPILKSVFFGNDTEEYITEKYSYKYAKGDEFSENKILTISIQGIILTESADIPNPLDVLSSEGATYGYSVKETLVRAADDDDIKGILLQINSPGGTIAGSKAIADGIEYYRKETGRPVYAHIRDIGASGAYWAAIVADKVIVDTGSMVGSIGVIMGPFTYYNNVVEEGSFLGNVRTEDGIEHTYFTAGKYKDTGSPYRPLSQEEKDHWQRSLDNEYNIFVSHVSKYRKIPSSVIRDDIKAFPYENERAKKLGLIDEVGSNDDALSELLTKAKISKDDYQLIREIQKSSIFEDVFGVISQNKKSQVTLVDQITNTPVYLYAKNYNTLR